MIEKLPIDVPLPTFLFFEERSVLGFSVSFNSVDRIFSISGFMICRAVSCPCDAEPWSFIESWITSNLLMEN